MAGMHRSGTSALTRILSLLGARLSSDLMSAAPDNPSGFWESREVCRLNDQLLASVGLAWDHPGSIEQQRIEGADGDCFRTELRRYLHREFRSAPLFVLKDPRICRLTPIWLEVLNEFGVEVAFVIPVRNPLEVADSLQARTPMPRTWCLLLWLRYVLDAERHTRGFPRAFITFEALLEDWRRVTTGLVQRLGLGIGEPPPAAARAIDDYLREALRHHAAAGTDVPGSTVLGSWVRTTYDIALRATREDVTQDGRQRLDAVSRDLDETVPLLLPTLSESRELREAALSELGCLQARLERSRAAEAALQARLDARERELANLQASRSWRWTRPLRFLSASLARFAKR